MSKAKSIFILLCAVLSVLFFVVTSDAAKGSGGCKDRDNDGYFQKAGCGTAVDCNDDDAAINPGAAEVCDSIDNNCDGTVDEGCGGCTDNDGDGYGNGPDCLGPDCDDSDSGINPAATEVCGNDIDEDCDGFDDICPGCTDNDGDGYGDGTDCLGPDCDDTDSAVNPGASEVCDDNIDNNCDGTVDEDCGGCVPTASKEKGCDCFDNTDNDCDGSIDSLDRDCKRQTCGTCFDDDGDGWYTCGGDCDDNNPAINPGAPEVCNGIDDDCDGSLPIEEQDADGDGVSICEGDCDDNNPSRSPNNTEASFGYPVCNDGIDNDCDNDIDNADSGCASPCTDADNDGFNAEGGICGLVDCNDNDPNIRPFAPEICTNGVDDNCDGEVDGTGTGGADQCCFDNDFDGFDGQAFPHCAGPVDCNDNDPNIRPFAPEICTNGVDDNCDGEVDGTGTGGADQCCFDNDFDGFDGQAFPHCAGPVDCNDNDPNIRPFAPEICTNGVDDNCDGEVDGTGTGGADQCCFDNDFDGFDGQAFPHCQGPVDCNDNDPNIRPFAPEICTNGVDDNCDGEVDGTGTGGADQCCFDNDFDGFDGQAFPHCAGPVDCNDNDPNIRPFAPEICTNGVDDNCDGEVDGTGTGGADQCCFDNDFDGFDGQAFPHCAGPVDCNDNDPNIRPFAPEICTNGVDDNCDGEVDGTGTGGADQCCFDNDFDGFDGQAFPHCAGPVDCNDNDPNIRPFAPEICTNGVDDNCDGEVDGTGTGGADQCCFDNDFDGFDGQAFPHCAGPVDCDDADPSVNPSASEGPTGDPTCYDTKDNDCDSYTDAADPDCVEQCPDMDGDGFNTCDGDCDDTDPTVCPTCPLLCDGKDNNCDGFLDFPDDIDADGDGVPACAECNDNDPNIYPGNTEGPFGDPTCSDGLDNDCDLMIDELDPDCAPPSCITKISPKDGPHIFDLLDPADDSVIATPCSWCHTDVLVGSGTADERFACQRCHADPSDTSDPLNGTLKALYPLSPPYGFGTALNVKPHSSTVVGLKYGNWDTECLTCHNPHQQEQDNKHGTTYGKLIKEYICFDNPNTGLNIEEIVQFTAASGPGSFADGPPHNENICEMCHTLTEHHQADGTAPGGQSHNDGADCTACHAHEDGFGTGIIDCFGPHDIVTDCAVCHDPGTYITNAPIPNSKCDECHTPGGSLKAGYPTAPDVETHQGNSFSFIIDCVECHTDHCNTNNLALIRSTIAGSIFPGSQIVFTAPSGPGSFADGAPYEENICDTCHSMTNHHQADGSAPAGQAHNDGLDCTGCHTHNPGAFFPTF